MIKEIAVFVVTALMAAAQTMISAWRAKEVAVPTANARAILFAAEKIVELLIRLLKERTIAVCKKWTVTVAKKRNTAATRKDHVMSGKGTVIQMMIVKQDLFVEKIIVKGNLKTQVQKVGLIVVQCLPSEISVYFKNN